MRKRLFASAMVLMGGFGVFALIQDNFLWPSSSSEHVRLIRNTKPDTRNDDKHKLLAANRALSGALPVTFPFREVGYLQALQPAAAGYLFKVHKGRKLRVDFSRDKKDSVDIFFYLYELPADSSLVGLRPVIVQRADHFTYEPAEGGRFFLRLYAESFTTVKYTLRFESSPSLHFPVAGAGNNAIGCYFGASRGGGARKHLGIDIFAPYNTPVVASADGIVTRVTRDRLGGKVVWLREGRRGLYFYYAHLSKQLCRPGQQVEAGDTLGLIGQTGNAHSTDPHLHYGVYAGEFIDPYPYVYKAKEQPVFADSDVRRLGQWARVKRNTLLRDAPSQLSPVHKDVPLHTMLHVTGYRQHWAEVRLADGYTGFIPRHQIEPAAKPIFGVTIHTPSRLTFSSGGTEPGASDTLQPGDALLVFGKVGKSLHVRSFTGQTGWIPQMHASVVSSSVEYQ
ncbi:MAG: peptidoglycan DD-metalloendopeptidase family protein [Chitinispirillaceae bacterium]